MRKYEGIVVHFGELWLKGRNRHIFVEKLHKNIQEALKRESYSRIEDLRDRLLVVLNGKSDIKSIEARLSCVFGISWIAPVITSKNGLAEILKASNALIGKNETVRIVPNRSVKDTDFNSSDIVSFFIRNSARLKFNIDKDAEKELYINIIRNRAILYKEKIQAEKGLPVGSSGRAIVLLSGGIDSPVASFYAMKRGLYPIYMHVHAFPDNDDKKLNKIKGLVKILARHSAGSTIYFIPGHVFQTAALKVPRKYELVLFKYFLYRIAESIAEKENSNCIVSGESLGQVASQTLSNLSSSQYGIKPFIMRPLIGFDKQEIINAAKRIGTFDISIKKYKDVCSIEAQNPATSSTDQLVRKLSKEMEIEDVIRKSLKRLGVSEITPK